MASGLLDASTQTLADAERGAAKPATTGNAPRRPSVWPRVALLSVCLAVYAVVLFRCAWITEDTYIMFRTTDNVLHGHGATWNLGERVQVYTCPLWFGLLLPFHALTGEYYFTALTVSYVVSLLTVGLVRWRLAPTTGGALVAAAIFTASKGFIDYSTSGLENPLTHLLLAVFCGAFFRLRELPTPRGLFALTLLATLGMVNRLDTALLYAPTLLWFWWQVPKRAGTGVVMLGVVPLFAWEVFSVIYYGFLFPNTAYAKLNLGLPASVLMLQGLRYYLNALRTDPLALAAIAAALAGCVLGRRWRDLPLAIGVVLYLMYIVKVGGDYMAMRFLTAPLLLSVILLVRFSWPANFKLALAVSVLALGVSAVKPRSPLRSGTRFGTGHVPTELDKYGIADERGFWHARLGLLAVRHARRAGAEDFPSLIERVRHQCRSSGHQQVIVRRAIGVSVFPLPDSTIVIDSCALATPLLAHLPISRHGRVGHYDREHPPGYLDTVQTGVNQFEDPNLGAYYEKLRLIVAGDLWDAQRWQAIWEMNTGQLSHLIDREYYRRPLKQRAASSKP